MTARVRPRLSLAFYWGGPGLLVTLSVERLILRGRRAAQSVTVPRAYIILQLLIPVVLVWQRKPERGTKSVGLFGMRVTWPSSQLVH